MKTRIAFLIGALVGAIILGIALNSVLQSYSIKRLDATTEGTVINSVRTSVKSGWSKVTVEYSPANSEKITASAQTRQRLSTGDQITIWYDPANPSKIDFGDSISYNMRAVLLGAFILGFCIYVVFRLTKKANQEKKLIQSGKKVSAEIASVGRNERFMQGDKNPWIINCRWKDNQGQEYFFTSKNFSEDPGPYLLGKRHLDVYFDPGNPSSYYIDTSFIPAEKQF